MRRQTEKCMVKQLTKGGKIHGNSIRHHRVCSKHLCDRRVAFSTDPDVQLRQLMGIFKRGRPSRQTPPRSPGLYRWVDKGTEHIDYVGETNDLRRRHYEHVRSSSPFSGESHHFEWKRADGRSTSRTRRQIEKEKIAKHHPPLNSNSGGGGRRAR